MALLHSAIGLDTDIDPRDLQLYLDLGLKLKKVHQVIKFANIRISSICKTVQQNWKKEQH